MTSPNQTHPPGRVVDMRISLSWLISGAAISISALGSTLWTVAAQTNKLDQIIIVSEKLEKRLDDRDEKTEVLRERMFNFDRMGDNLKLRIDALERSKK